MEMDPQDLLARRRLPRVERHSEGLASLDAKILAALFRIVTGPLKARLEAADDKCLKKRRMFKGRHAPYLMDQYFQSKAQQMVLLSWEALVNVHADDGNLEDFITRWGKIIDTLGSGMELDHRLLATLFASR